MMEKYGKVLVLMGGWSNEREISLVSGSFVYDSLIKSGVNTINLDLTKKNCSLLDENKNLNFLKLDLTNFKIDPINSDLFFLDPPYDEINIEKVLELLKKNKSINKKSIGIIETPYKKQINMPEDFKRITIKKVSNSNFYFLKKI